MDEQKRGSLKDGYLPPDHIDEDFEEEFDDYSADEDSDEDDDRGDEAQSKDKLPTHALTGGSREPTGNNPHCSRRAGVE